MLSQASFFKADLTEADLAETDLTGANLQQAVLERTNLRGANLANANLCFATLLTTNLENAVLDNCAVYGTSFWDVAAADSSQRDLDIMPAQQPVLSVDSLQTAQLVGMLLHHEKARYEVFSITLNTVLVIGRFPPERQPVLTAIKEALRRGRLLAPRPRLPPARLGRQERDRQDARPDVPVRRRRPDRGPAHLRDPRRRRPLPAVHPHPAHRPGGRRGRGPADSHYGKYRWVLPLWRFRDPSDLAARIGREVVDPAERKAPRSGSDTSSPPARV